MEVVDAENLIKEQQQTASTKLQPLCIDEESNARKERESKYNRVIYRRKRISREISEMITH